MNEEGTEAESKEDLGEAAYKKVRYGNANYKSKIRKFCISRESNPGPNDGNVGFYH